MHPRRKKGCKESERGDEEQKKEEEVPLLAHQTLGAWEEDGGGIGSGRMGWVADSGKKGKRKSCTFFSTLPSSRVLLRSVYS